MCGCETLLLIGGLRATLFFPFIVDLHVIIEFPCRCRTHYGGDCLAQARRRELHTVLILGLKVVGLVRILIATRGRRGDLYIALYYSRVLYGMIK